MEFIQINGVFLVLWCLCNFVEPESGNLGTFSPLYPNHAIEQVREKVVRDFRLICPLIAFCRNSSEKSPRPPETTSHQLAV
ncbi:MAG: hypothetical protein ACRCUY_02900 [Thermoguttaceae bacterium]